jgi:hypothetical protein
MHMISSVPNAPMVRDYDYVELTQAAKPHPDAARARIYREKREGLEREISLSLGGLALNKRSYDQISGRSTQSRARDIKRLLWESRRLENTIRHEAALSRPKMVATMLDNWPAWYPVPLKPSAEVRAEDEKRRAKKLSKRAILRQGPKCACAFSGFDSQCPRHRNV